MGKKKSGTSRTTISVPVALKKRMDEATEPVNWSAIAAAAFQQKLSEIAERKDRKTMSDAIERLRGSKRKSDTAEYKEGEAAGRDWAMHTAEAAQLERLRVYLDTFLGHDEVLLFDPVASAYSGAEVIYFSIDPECGEDRDSADGFWTMALGETETEQTIQPESVRGFVQGALDVWNEVRTQL
jgi:hypothetical protein